MYPHPLAALAVRNLRNAPGRTIASTVGVALACALMCAIALTALDAFVMLKGTIVATQGAWEISFDNVDGGVREKAEADPLAQDVCARARLGVAELPENLRTEYAHYITLRSYCPDGIRSGLLPAPRLEEGSAPKTGAQIMLPITLKGARAERSKDAMVEWAGDLEVGTTVQVRTGVRRGGDEDSARNVALNDDTYYTPLHGTGHSKAKEAIEQVGEPVALTVSGFYTSESDLGTSEPAYVGEGAALRPRAWDVYLTTNADSRQALNRQIQRSLPEAEIYGSPDAYPDEDVPFAQTKDQLLAYRGPLFAGSGPSEIAILGTGTAVLLVLVALFAAGLVYNVTRISIAGRVRELGVLASIGASPRQLGRLLAIESAMICALAVPVGAAAGAAGAWAGARSIGAGIFTFLSSDTERAGSYMTGTEYALPVIAACAALVCTVVMLSARIPARSAQRLSPIEALRGTSDKAPSQRPGPSAGAGRRAGLAARTGTNPQRVRARLYRTLAHRNYRRQGSTSRGLTLTLALSMAMVSVSLLAVAYCDRSIEEISVGKAGYDLIVGAQRMRAADETGPRAVEEIERERARMQGLPGVAGASWSAGVYALGTMSPGMAQMSPSAREALNTFTPITDEKGKISAVEGTDEAALAPDGTYAGYITLDFVDQATWENILRMNKIDPDRVRAQEGKLTALAVAPKDPEDDAVRIVGPGEAELYTGIDMDEGQRIVGVTAPDDDPRLVTVRERGDRAEIVQTAQTQRTGRYRGAELVRTSDAVTGTATVHVAALAKKVPRHLDQGIGALWPGLILPASELGKAMEMAGPAKETANMDITSPFSFNGDEQETETWLSLTYTIKAVDDEVAERGLSALVAQDMSLRPWCRNFIGNIAREDADTILVAKTAIYIVAVFCGACALIGGLSIVSTVLSAVRLRTNEFAVYQSVGMRAGDVARMVMRECALVVSRALLACLALEGTALLAAAAILGAEGIESPFSALAVLIVSLVAYGALLAISARYALRRALSQEISDRLRKNAV